MGENAKSATDQVRGHLVVRGLDHECAAGAKAYGGQLPTHLGFGAGGEKYQAKFETEVVGRKVIDSRRPKKGTCMPFLKTLN